MQPVEPHQHLLDREHSRSQARDAFPRQLECLESLTNYFSNLVVRAFVLSPRELSDGVVIACLLKQAATSLDGATVLLCEGSAQAARVQYRALLEASVSIEWILQRDTPRRALAYHIANMRKRRLWALRAIPGTPEHQALQDKCQAEGISRTPLSPEQVSRAQQEVAEIDAILTSPACRDLNADFEAFYARRSFECSWHLPVGANSVRTMFSDVGRGTEYTSFYASASEAVHASGYAGSVAMEPGKLTFSAVRNLDRVEQVLTPVIITAIHTIRVILNQYRPGELPNFQRRYTETWRPAFRSIPSIEVNPITVDIG